MSLEVDELEVATEDGGEAFKLFGEPAHVAGLGFDSFVNDDNVDVFSGLAGHFFERGDD